MIHIHINAPLKRMAKPEPLPQVNCTEAEARQWFSGWWHGIAVGLVTGGGLAVVINAVVG